MAHSLEVKAGRLTVGAIRERATGIISMQMLSGDSPYREINSRYVGTNLGDPVLSNEVLGDILFRGVVDSVAIRQSIDRSTYYVKLEDEPAWRAAWHWMERDDADTARAVDAIESQVQRHELVTPGELLHIVGLRLWFSEVGAIAIDSKQVVEESKAYIDNLYSSGKLQPTEAWKDRVDISSGYGGFGYSKVESDEFRVIYAYLAEKREKVSQDQFPQKAEELLEELKRDPWLFYRRLNLTNSSDNTFFDIPILPFLKVDSFISTFLSLSPAHQRTALRALGDRYTKANRPHVVAAETAWLQRIHDAIADAASELSGVAKIRIKSLLSGLIAPVLLEMSKAEWGGQGAI